MPVIVIANSLDPDQARQNVGPDLGPNCMTRLCYSQKHTLENVDLERKSVDDEKHAEFPSIQRVIANRRVLLDCEISLASPSSIYQLLLAETTD